MEKTASLAEFTKFASHSHRLKVIQQAEAEIASMEDSLATKKANLAELKAFSGNNSDEDNGRDDPVENGSDAAVATAPHAEENASAGSD